jgi:hypothetical protein
MVSRKSFCQAKVFCDKPQLTFKNITAKPRGKKVNAFFHVKIKENIFFCKGNHHCCFSLLKKKQEI